MLVLSLNIFNPFIDFNINEIKNDFPLKQESDSLGVDLSATNAIVVDSESGKILFAKNSHESVPIASITKLMSVLVVIDLGIDWGREVVITEEDKREGGKVYLGMGEKVTIDNLVNLSLIASDNQSVATLARVTGFSEDDFVNLMNEKAKNLGMSETEFFDPTGLDVRNVSSPDDLVKLAKKIFSIQRINEILSKDEYEFKELSAGISHKVYSTDKLLSSFLKDGEEYILQSGKTGYLPEAGYCFLSKATNKDGKEIIIAVLGSSSDYSRFQETKGLIVWSFNNWRWK